ncbi:4'-phosphopantetheinyl transferase [Marinobacter salinus]|uniref:4'-phosphopantetheinyl transferase n=1 Tax=Marinobacter salinus TaxID=1874317 RepID=A0A1D9GP43_9GAMM|nr:4'-phosphopantetheinyl transferase superfamily protein [Marinobacter salinus]AOY89291.1 4'-phosphopantetheinyl transferase [Marinobacter salinus]
MAGSYNDCSPEQSPTIWLCHEGGEATSRLPAWLTAYERETVAKFSGPRKREYLASRWLIRQAIAGASGQSASSCSPVDGRPVHSGTPAGWRLSLSHSHGLSACATSQHSPIGLDIEPCQRHPQWQKVTRRWFTTQEQQWLLRDDNPETFLKVWTLKEAWLKATERGIADNLQTLEVGPGFELLGDRQEQGWQAWCCIAEGFLVTLVYRMPVQSRDLQPPKLVLLTAPPDDFSLVRPDNLAGSDVAVLHAPIHTKQERRNQSR